MLIPNIADRRAAFFLRLLRRLRVTLANGVRWPIDCVVRLQPFTSILLRFQRATIVFSLDRADRSGTEAAVGVGGVILSRELVICGVCSYLALLGCWVGAWLGG